jgi:hypothetical protein
MSYSTKNYTSKNDKNEITTGHYFPLRYKNNYSSKVITSAYIEYDFENQYFILKSFDDKYVNFELYRSIYDGQIIQLLIENQTNNIFRFNVVPSNYNIIVYLLVDLRLLTSPIYYNNYVHKVLVNLVHKNKQVSLKKHMIPAKNEIIEEEFPNLQIELFQYQKNNVVWMDNLEKLTDLGLNKYEYFIQEDNNCQKIKLDNLDLYMNTESGVVFTDINEVFKSNELKLNGGVLHDEVGLGKTFSCLTHIIRSLDRELKITSKKKKKEKKVKKEGKKEGER